MVRYNFPEYQIELEIDEEVYFPSEDTFFLINSLEIKHDYSLIYEIGGGSGIITIALAKQNPKIRFVVTDISYKAAKSIDVNRRLNGINNQIDIVCMDKISALKRKSPNLIIWNPPYLPKDTESELLSNYEKLTLFGGKEGYEEVYELIDYLKKNNFKTTFLTLFSSLAWDTTKFSKDIEFKILNTTKFFFEKLYVVGFIFSDNNVK
ncbi:MAG: methyltransferase [Candidatus Heimdallarchaeota archaeon]|nr:methyltransferase [Candidatus Heimdallarchaeota archaeon]MCK4953906.1 methyltransferase [Candidatus Heimdallarchaeota archaeon]